MPRARGRKRAHIAKRGPPRAVITARVAVSMAAAAVKVLVAVTAMFDGDDDATAGREKLSLIEGGKSRELREITSSLCVCKSAEREGEEGPS